MPYMKKSGVAMKILKDFKKTAVHGVLNWLYNTKPLERHIGKEKVDLKAEPIKPCKIKVAAVQVQIKLHKTTIAYYDHMKRLVEESVKKGAQLIAFPENINLPLIGVIPMAEKLLTGHDSPRKPGSNSQTRENFFLLGPYTEKIYKLIFSTLAKKYQVFIMAGSISAPVGKELYNTAYFFGLQGECLGTQRKLHLTTTEEAFGLVVGDELNVITLPFGKVSFPICMDATYFETFHLARQKDADIVIIPIANNEEYDFYKAFRGTWHRVQEARVFGIKSALVGKLGDLVFTGRSAIFAPLDLTPRRDGVIQEAKTYNKEEVVVGEVDLNALRRFRERDPLLSDFNQEIYDKYLSLVKMYCWKR